jgi:hypothetical protein
MTKDHCPTCGHVIAKEIVNLSSIEFRRLIHKIDTLEELIDNKDRLYRFVKSFYNRDFANDFSENLESKINDIADENDDLDTIKLWLLGFINNEDRAFPPRENELYKFLLEDCCKYDTPFGEFYDSYSHWTENPMSKNRVSRALSAFGLKSVMKKIMCNGKMKCTMVLSATEEEIVKLREKNGFGNYCLDI